MKEISFILVIGLMVSCMPDLKGNFGNLCCFIIITGSMTCVCVLQTMWKTALTLRDFSVIQRSLLLLVLIWSVSLIKIEKQKAFKKLNFLPSVSFVYQGARFSSFLAILLCKHSECYSLKMPSWLFSPCYYPCSSLRCCVLSTGQPHWSMKLN